MENKNGKWEENKRVQACFLRPEFSTQDESRKLTRLEGKLPPHPALHNFTASHPEHLNETGVWGEHEAVLTQHVLTNIPQKDLLWAPLALPAFVQHMSASFRGL